MRTLAKAITKENIISLLDQSVKDHQSLQYLISGSRKHRVLYITSAEMILYVLNNLSEMNKARILDRYEEKEGIDLEELADFCHKLIDKALILSNDKEKK